MFGGVRSVVVTDNGLDGGAPRTDNPRMKPPADRTRVVKTLSPTQPGAVKLAEKYGATLVCVRYRQDTTGLRRYTTVELIVESSAMVKRPSRLVGVKLPFDDSSLRMIVRASGGVWDSSAKVWRMRYRVAASLGLLERVVE